MGSTERFFRGCLYRRAGSTPARPRGEGRATRETDSIVSTLRARRAGHGARARLATGESPVDSPSGEPSGAEIGLARPPRKRPAGPKKHNFTLLHILLSIITLCRQYEITPKKGLQSSRVQHNVYLVLRKRE